MSQMSADQVWAYFWLKMAATVGVVIVLVTTVICAENAWEYYRMSAMGYVESTLPGTHGIYWVKPTEKCHE